MAASSWITKSIALLVISLANAQDLNFNFPFHATTPVPYTLSVNPEFVKETVYKAKHYRPSIDLLDGETSNAGWLEGPPREDMIALAKYWGKSYDWHQIQNEINRNFSHFAVNIQSGSGPNSQIPIHFVHERSAAKNALPLILLHGWPSTHLEWSKVIGPLVSPGDHGAQAFHVVAPDLPGFGFSPAPKYTNLGPRRMGQALHQLMGQLGYKRYGVVGTDIGWEVGLTMADSLPDNIVGYFSDFWVAQPNSTDLERLAQNKTTEEETQYISAFSEWFGSHSSYSTVHQQAPLAIGQAMSDTPVGFAGWMWHAMMLFIQGTFGNLRLYKEMAKDTPTISFVKVPTGVSEWGSPNGFFKGIEKFGSVPRDWLQRSVNLVYFSKHETGGHFPAINEPELWVRDVQEFFGSLAR